MSETKSENGYEGNDKTVVVNNPFSKLESKMKVLTDVNDTDSDENEENDNDAIMMRIGVSRSYNWVLTCVVNEM
jgi:hypothetical protein